MNTLNMDTLRSDSVSLFRFNSTPKKIAIVAVAGISLGAIGFGIVSLFNSSINIYAATSLVKLVVKTANVLVAIIISSSLAFGGWAYSQGFSIQESFYPLATVLLASAIFITILRLIIFMN